MVLQQFLRFGETKAIAQEIILQDTKDRHDVLVKQTSRAESDIKKFIERSNMSMQNYIKSYESTRQLFGARPVPFIPPGTRLMSPLISPSSYSPNRESRTHTTAQTPATTATSLPTTPLSRIQVLQPFDARLEQTSPAAINTQNANTIEKTTVIKPSPICESPKNLSTSTVIAVPVSASPSSLTHQIQQIQQQQLNVSQLTAQSQDDEVDGEFGSDDSEEEGEILDFSNKENPDSPSDNQASKLHMRKSSNPIKRQWTPSANFGSTFVGPNGKKRVLCTACNKTFCDKGALKIHYSAVHLKEMHKCTVEGCNMMFSSRRSRNRHSANPNPKLHMPQSKRKEDEDDDMPMSQLGVMSPSNGGNIVHVIPSSATTLPSPVSAITVPASSIPLLETPGIVRPNATNFFLEMSAQFPFLSPPEKRLKLEQLDRLDQPTDLSKISKTIANVVAAAAAVANAGTSEEMPCDLSKKIDIGERKLEIDLDAPCNEKEEPQKEIEPEQEEEASKCENGRSGSRRKNNAPIRCAQNQDSGATSDDNSDDKDGKGRPLNNNIVNGTNSSSTVAMDTTEDTHCPSSKGQSDGNQRAINNETNSASDKNQNVEKYDTFLFTGMSRNIDRSEAHNFPKIASLLCASGSLIETDTTDNGKTSPVSEIKTEIKEENGDEEHSNPSEADSAEENETEICLPDFNQEYPPDVYVDKENPLKCKICEKVFQNSFTVKIHFQNVHLKVMHACKVEGCSSMFPSKRSRDRHSANLNLHRRLLAGEGTVEEEMDASTRGDILAKLYGHDLVNKSVPLTATDLHPPVTVIHLNDHESIKNNNNNIESEDKKVIPIPTSIVENLSNSNKTTDAPEVLKNGFKTILQNGFQGVLVNDRPAVSSAIGEDNDGDDSSKRDLFPIEPFKMTCHVCGDKFSNPLVLQDHISSVHPEQTADGADYISANQITQRKIRQRQKPRIGVATRKNTVA